MSSRTAQAPLHTKAYIFEACGTDALADGSFEFTLPTRHEAASVELASFETQGVEPNLTESRNRLSWTEGLAIGTGEQPTVYGGVPVFDHEFCIRETEDDGTYRYFKVGLVPYFNELSTVVWDQSAAAGAGARLATNSEALLVSANVYFSTTRNTPGSGPVNYAAPHYLAEAQAAFSAGLLQDMQFFAGCWCTQRPVDLMDDSVVNFTDPPANPAPPGGGVHMRLTTNAARDSYLTGVVPNGVTVQSVTQGFLCASKWFPPDIAAFVNFQLGRVRDSAGVADTPDAYADFNRPGTTGAPTRNTYHLQHVHGRFRFVRTGGSTTFAILNNVSGPSPVAGWRDMFHGDGTGVFDGNSAQAAAPPLAGDGTAPTGSSGHTTCLWDQLGFLRTEPADDVTTVTRSSGNSARVLRSADVRMEHGIEAGREVRFRFESTVDAAYHTPQTLATATTASMNLGRPASTSAAAPNTLNTAFTLVDSLGVSRTVAVGAGQRTPHQLAAALEFALNRLDGRGVFHSGSNNFALGDAHVRHASGHEAGTATVHHRLLWYTCTYDDVVGKFSITNREVASVSLENSATTYPATASTPLLVFPAATTRAPFQFSFRASDLQTSAATLGVAAVETSSAARLLGFVPERVYRGTRLTPPHRSSCAVSHENALTQGLHNDTVPGAVAENLRPLGAAVGTAASLHQNRVDYRGAGPDRRCYPQHVYGWTGSFHNDKKYTAQVRLPRLPRSVTSTAQKTGSATGNPGAGVYNSNDLDVTVTVDSRRIATIPAIQTASTSWKNGDLFAVGGTGTPSDALGLVLTNTSTGAVATAGVLFGGSGTATDAYADGDFVGYKLNAQQGLRIVAGSDGFNAFHATQNHADASRVVVQAGEVRERAGTYRGTQACLPFAPGDFVELGFNQSLLVGDFNVGAHASHSLDVTQVSHGGQLLAGTAARADVAGAYEVHVGHHYVVLQGDCKTVVRVLTVAATSYTFAVVRHGSGHAVASGIRVFGPVLPHGVVGMVEEVMQPNYRRTTAAASHAEGAFNARHGTLYQQSTGAYVCAAASVARDGSLLKIRLPYLCRYRAGVGVEQHSFPSNLLHLAPVAAPRFQLLNDHPNLSARNARSDTLWHMMGARHTSEVGRTLKMPFEWNLAANSGIFITLEDNTIERNNVLVRDTFLLDNILAKITYNTPVSRSWAMVHSKSLRGRNLHKLRIRLLDSELHNYNLNGCQFSITFNINFRV